VLFATIGVFALCGLDKLARNERCGQDDRLRRLSPTSPPGGEVVRDHDPPSALLGVTVLGYDHELVEIDALAAVRA
jgi:hypothetical protein